MDLRPGMMVVDGTLGAGGHAAAFLSKVLPGGFLLGLDRDPRAAELGERELIRAGYTRGKHFEVKVWRFSQVEEALAPRHTGRLDRLFVDLGVCSLHLDQADRGFSLKHDGALDMRLNPAEPGSQSAADLVNEADAAELARIIWEYGEERWSRRIANAIVRERAKGPIRGTLQLRDIVAGAIPRKAWPRKVDPATRTFMALRIAVNGELEEVDTLLSKLPNVMGSEARTGVLTFHSLEDRRVKAAFRELSRECVCPPEQPVCTCGRKPKFRLVTKRPGTAGPQEVDENPRSRSAKLRVLERIAD